MALWMYNDHDDWPVERPYHPHHHQLLDQHFGIDLEPEDFIGEAPMISRGLHRAMRLPTGYRRPWRSHISQQDVGSTIDCGKDGFTVHLDVQQFRPNEITVQVTGDDTVIVEGKHEEKPDEHGHVSRQFIRKYVVPKGHDISKIESKLSLDGVLTITAPKIDTGELKGVRPVPIIHTGIAFKAVKPKKGEEKKK